MKNLSAAVLGLAITLPAIAAAGVTVPLPDTSKLAEPEARALLTQIAQANVITSNCPDYAVSDAEWSLITGTGDQLAAQLKMDNAAYDKQVYGPAFKLLEDPSACDRIGPTAKPLIAKLKSMGGAVSNESASQ